jgi:3-dehydroquinate synthetase
LLGYKLDNLDFEMIYNFMRQDKKNDNWKITFVLMKNFWEPLLYEVLDKKILEKTFDDFVQL